jgi:AAA+ superfamily predicted ATPase
MFKQRAKVLVEMLTARAGEGQWDPKQSGLVLSGPHGVGKSVMQYMLACSAWVRV